jgi:hypothetical protein
MFCKKFRFQQYANYIPVRQIRQIARRCDNVLQLYKLHLFLMCEPCICENCTLSIICESCICESWTLSIICESCICESRTCLSFASPAFVKVGPCLSFVSPAIVKSDPAIICESCNFKFADSTRLPFRFLSFVATPFAELIEWS